MNTTHLDTSLHRRLHDKQMQDPEYRAEYLRAQAAIAQVDAVIHALDELRTHSGRSKAELARQIGKEPAVIRRMFTAQVNPELRTIAALAAALGAEIRIVRRRPRRSSEATVGAS